MWIFHKKKRERREKKIGGGEIFWSHSIHVKHPVGTVLFTKYHVIRIVIAKGRIEQVHIENQRK